MQVFRLQAFQTAETVIRRSTAAEIILRQICRATKNLE